MEILHTQAAHGNSIGQLSCMTNVPQHIVSQNNKTYLYESEGQLGGFSGLGQLWLILAGLTDLRSADGLAGPGRPH